MRVKKIIIKEDNKIKERLEGFNKSEIARKAGITPTALYDALAGRYAISERTYLLIVEELERLEELTRSF